MEAMSMADKFYCYGKDDLGDRYDALYVKDPEGDWVLASDYDAAQARIRELEFRISEIQSIRNAEAKISEIRRQLACELEAQVAALHVDAQLDIKAALNEIKDAYISKLEAALYKIMERTAPPDENYYDAYHALT